MVMRAGLGLGVLLGLGLAAGSARSEPGGRAGPEISQEARVEWSRADVLEGQQVHLDVSLTHPVALEPSWEAPVFEGFASERLPSEGGLMEHDAQGRAVRTTRFTRVLFPMRSGELAVPASSIVLQARSGEQTRIRVPATQLSVDPVPAAGRPDGFSGLVGELSVRVTLGERRVALDGALELRVDVLGTAHLDDLPLAARLDALLGPGGEVFADPPVVARILRERDLITRYSVELAVVPARVGPMQVPALEIPYFDTTFSRYRTARTEPLTVRVEPASVVPGGAAASGEASDPGAAADLRDEVRAEDAGGSGGAVLSGWGLVGVLAACAGLATAALALAWGRRSRGHADAEPARERSASPPPPGGVATRGLVPDPGERPGSERAAADVAAGLREAERASSPEEMLAALRRVLRTELCLRHGARAAAWTASDLASHTSDADGAALLRRLDRARFGHRGGDPAAARECIAALRGYLEAR